MERTATQSDGLQLWGGVECTVNRVGDQYFDQIVRTGHDTRDTDIDRFAALGVRKLRVPVLWERVAPAGIASADWSWSDRQLGRLRELAVAPIVGLVHHGSGPPETQLDDPSFAERLAHYAAAVARRYPWVDHYTPVNEPLTTARFSGLYGHWYPHAANAAVFARALLHQCRGVVLAMQAVRQVTPHARLIQTEDLGQIFSTPRLAYQATFENERRWLTFDLLCGRVRRGHPMWRYLRHVGILARDLAWFQEHPCPPDIVGVNYYLTSERFLDHQVDRYPPALHGGNGRDTYVDVEAVRVRTEGMAGPRPLLDEVASRYGLPIAVTEVHNGCTREEQMRWFLDVWHAARSLREEGRDVRAVTAWALLGTYDWNSLVTRTAGHYEPGLFDLRAPTPRPTALARMVSTLGAGEQPSHPVLQSPGWWRRSRRLMFGGSDAKAEILYATRRVIITGGAGMLGVALGRRAEVRGLAHWRLTRRDLDITDPEQVDAVIVSAKAWAVINAAGYQRVDAAEADRDRCFRENVDGPTVLAERCRHHGVRLVTFSSDLVFDGAHDAPYNERASPSPVSAYGASKVAAERAVLGLHPDALVVRTGPCFGPWDDRNFVTTALRTIAAGQRYAAADDLIVSPTYVPDLVDAVLDLVIDDEQGIWHLTNEMPMTWAELARRAAERAGLDAGQIEGRPWGELGMVAPRPSNSALRSARGSLLPSLDDALGRYVNDGEGRWDTGPDRIGEPVPQRMLEA